jgi:DNA polymerase-3 subunit alpha
MLEDLEGAIEVMIFPSAYQLCSTVLAEDAIVFVKGRLDKREDVGKIIAMEVTAPDLSREAGGALAVSLALTRATPPLIGRLKEVLAAHPGTTEVHLQLHNGSKTTVVRLDDRLRVSPSPSLVGDLKKLLGPACLGA